MNKISIITAVLLGLGTAGVLAQDAPANRPDRPRGDAGGPGGTRPNPGEIFKRLDKNGDGKIAKDEAPERIAANFDKLDTNKDGFITPDELKARPPGAGGPGGPGGARPNPEDIFKRLDKNGDGKIAKDEAPERIAANFEKLDANKDGFITPEELKAARPGGPDAPRRPAAGGSK
jgi:collagen type III alpha